MNGVASQRKRPPAGNSETAAPVTGLRMGSFRTQAATRSCFVRVPPAQDPKKILSNFLGKCGSPSRNDAIPISESRTYPDRHQLLLCSLNPFCRGIFAPRSSLLTETNLTSISLRVNSFAWKPGRQPCSRQYPWLGRINSGNAVPIQFDTSSAVTLIVWCHDQTPRLPLALIIGDRACSKQVDVGKFTTFFWERAHYGDDEYFRYRYGSMYCLVYN